MADTERLKAQCDIIARSRWAERTQYDAGLRPPFYAEPVGGTAEWTQGAYFVRNVACNSFGRAQFNQQAAELIAEKMNELAANA